ncbi:uncharacterized protein LOC112576112 isoform X1 [Pomacea canaliculata]|uniref:uncharacterized protein LOC112576112 isoform X1 n=1 Tax=Pomacea canaliculata TaxID=400727 RepID=UPI000D72923E|nr:uncharacterized protein LOC112576112 isoform X1 [Pomacea canaliculata]
MSTGTIRCCLQDTMLTPPSAARRALGIGAILVASTLWSVVAAVQDVRMLTMFVLTQTLAYYVNHVHGMLFVATLLSILWTKQVAMQWWKGQLLTTKFFIRLGYLLLPLAGSLLLTMFLWTPLYRVYASVNYIFDPFTGYYLMQWREILFVVAGLFIFYKAVRSLEFWRSADRQTLTGSCGEDSQPDGRTRLQRINQCTCDAVSQVNGKVCRTFRRARLGLHTLWPSAGAPTATLTNRGGRFLQSTMSENPDGPQGSRSLVVLSHHVDSSQPAVPHRLSTDNIMFVAPSHAIAQEAGTSGRSKCRGRQRMTADLEIASTSSSGRLHARRTAPVTRSQHRTFLLEKRGGVKAQFLRECRHPLHLCEPCQCR